MEDLFGINPNEKFYNDDYDDNEYLENGDDYYEDLENDEDEFEDEEAADSDDNDVTKVNLSFACEDCDYRWDDVIIGNKDDIEREEFDVTCPMCGSDMITQI